MIEHDQPEVPRHGLGGRVEPTAVPAGQALTSLLDLHRRGVIDDAQFAALSRNLAGTAAVPVPRAAAAAPRRRGAAGSLSRRSSAVVAGAALLVLAAAAVSLAVLPVAGKSSVELASLSGSADVDNVAPSATAERTSKPGPSSSATTNSSTPVSSDDAAQDPQAAATTGRDSATSGSTTHLAPPAVPAPARAAAVAPVPAPKPPAAAPVPAPKPAAAAPVSAPKPLAAPPVDCRAYQFAKEDDRLKYEVMSANISIELDIALRTGNLDEAARLQSKGEALELQRSLDDARLQAQYPNCR